MGNHFNCGRLAARSVYAFLLLLFLPFISFSQGEIPVNSFTGTGNFTIPIWNVASRDVNDPVSLTYNVKGVKLNERGNGFGVAWDINAGGSVSREVRGLPDDFKGTGNDRRRGWLYQKYSTSTYLSSDVAALPNTADNTGGSPCSDESSDYNQLNGYGYDNDTEPDIYYFNAGGYSGSFVFDNNATSTPVVRLIPYQDIKIVPTFVPGDSDPKITGFTITTNTGTVFTFNEGVWESRYTEKMISETTVEFLKTRYELYSKLGNHDNKAVGYNLEWKLTKTASPTGDELTYTYRSEEATSVDTVRAYMIRNSNSQYYTVNVFSDTRTTTYKYLFRIFVKETASSTKKALEITTSEGVATAIKIYDYRAGGTDGYVKQFNLGYTTAADRKFLWMVMEVSGTEQVPPYEFRYRLKYLPSKHSKDQDYWGYYNGKSNTHLAPRLYVYPGQSAGERFRLEKLPGYTEGTGQYTLAGADRSVDTTYLQFGTLSQITYPTGGYVQIKYESNEYYDTLANQSFKGGGLRIKSLKYFDIINPNKAITKYFTYSDSGGKSYGRLISKPQFAVLTWEYRDPFSATEQLPFVYEDGEWGNYDKVIVRLEDDISASAYAQGSAVGYQQVKVSRPGAGYSIHEFDLPAVYGKSSSGVWSATQDKFARTTGCPSIQWLTSGINGFPFAPNPNLDHERGLLRRTRDYTESDTLVSDVQMNYQFIYKTGSAPDYVYGVKYEKYPNSDANFFTFGKYFLITDVARVPLSEKVITIDSKTPSKTYEQITYHYHESAQHKLQNHTKTVLADGTEHHTYVRYPQDYPTTNPYVDEQTKAINVLKTTGRTGIPIETYQKIKKPSDSLYVTGGSIVKFSSFGVTGRVVPESTLSWQADSPVLNGSFTKSWTDESFYNDSRYQSMGTITNYGPYHMPLSNIGKSRVPGAAIMGYNSTTPVVTVTGATEAQFAFSDFETSTSVAFAKTGTADSTTGRTGLKSFRSGLTKTLSKGGSTYLLAFWLKHPGSAITINVKIQSVGSVNYYNTDLVFTPTTSANTFEYFEREIPIDPSLSTFKVVVTPVTGGTWYLDDVGFYPVNATLTSYTYTFPFGANSVTSGDATRFVEFDALGRVKYVKDKDGNILKKETIVLNNL